jgi:glucose-6-phosphate dehydrogenase assembly protein OpcA
VEAEAGNPSAPLIAGWLSARLGVRAKVVESRGPGITSVDVRFEDKGHVRIDRPDGHTATLARSGRPDRPLPLRRRDLGDLIAEELRRLDADQPYAEALEAATRTKGLNERPAKRTHIWKDPEPASRAKARPAEKKSAKQPATKNPAPAKNTSGAKQPRPRAKASR